MSITYNENKVGEASVQASTLGSSRSSSRQAPFVLLWTPRNGSKVSPLRAAKGNIHDATSAVQTARQYAQRFSPKYKQSEWLEERLEARRQLKAKRRTKAQQRLAKFRIRFGKDGAARSSTLERALEATRDITVAPENTANTNDATDGTPRTASDSVTPTTPRTPERARSKAITEVALPTANGSHSGEMEEKGASASNQKAEEKATDSAAANTHSLPQVNRPRNARPRRRPRPRVKPVRTNNMPHLTPTPRMQTVPIVKEKPAVEQPEEQVAANKDDSTQKKVTFVPIVTGNQPADDAFKILATLCHTLHTLKFSRSCSEESKRAREAERNGEQPTDSPQTKHRSEAQAAKQFMERLQRSHLDCQIMIGSKNTDKQYPVELHIEK